MWSVVVNDESVVVNRVSTDVVSDRVGKGFDVAVPVSNVETELSCVVSVVETV